jgi:hypothetical protein
MVGTDISFQMFPPSRRSWDVVDHMTLMYELKRRGGSIGVASICGGSSQGDSVLVRLNDRVERRGQGKIV